MKLLREFFRREGINVQGKTLCREAVRAIVIEKPKILMIYSARNGDYKFPGGGIKSGETHPQALAREMHEECGASISGTLQAFGKIIEYDIPREIEYEVFKMTSFYYWCKVEPVFHEPQLEQYEADLGYQPVWIDLEDVIHNNKSIPASGKNKTSRWLRRETFVLEQVKELITQEDYARYI
jgi:8-oxo-dGTP pyrophosphatase MutT (NUDIX family)